LQQYHHEFGAAHSEAKSSSDRSFGMVFAVVFLLIALGRFWHGTHTWPLYAVIGLGFAGVGLLRPALLAPLNRIWARLGLLLGKIVSPIVLGGLFFLIITPAAMILRWTGKDLLNLRREPRAATYWLVRDPPGPTPESINDQF
jgi:Saxitoxin biosynthesis operon protein SxtJ